MADAAVKGALTSVEDKNMSHLGRRRRVRRSRSAALDLRTLVLVAIPVGNATGTLSLLVASGGELYDSVKLASATAGLMLLGGVWALLRRRVTDSEHSIFWVLHNAVFIVQALQYTSANMHWVAICGLIGAPLVSLMNATQRWAVVSSALCLIGQLLLLVGIPASAVEQAGAVATLSFVMPIIVGNAWFLLRRSERLRLQAERAASQDSLTGLLNRRALRERWPALAQVAREHDEQPGVLLIDVDHFKGINDTHGHDAGDALLVALSQQLMLCTRADALVVRLGGEEFAVVDRFPDAAGALAAAERLRSVAHEVVVPGLPSVRVSIGVATSTATSPAVVAPGASVTDVLEALLSRADAALYVAKESGRDRVVLDEGLRPAVEAQPASR